jgi:hypothetical protein
MARLVAESLTERLRRRPPMLHGEGDAFLGLHWGALDWLERTVQPGMRTLETGCGTSTLVFAASGARHVAIQPDPGQFERVKRFCAEQGIDTGGLELIPESSHTALLHTWKPEPLDVVLVDGAHAFPFPALDWFYTQAHLRVGGHVLLDDAYLPSVGVLVRYLDKSPSWARVGVLGYRTPAFRKLDDVPPPFEHFGMAFDRRPSFAYLPPGRRFVTWARHLLFDRSPLHRVVRWAAARRGRGV